MKKNWISISVPPSFDIPVLVCEEGKKESIEVCRLNSKAEDSSGIKYYFYIVRIGCFDYYTYNVTHWQPLEC